MVQRNRGDVVVGHYLEYDVLIAVAEGRPENVGRVGRTGPVQYNRAFCRSQPGRNGVPLGVRRDVDR